MKKKYFHNEVIKSRGDDLNKLCLVDLLGKAVVVNPLDSKIMRVLHAGDTIGVDYSLKKTKLATLTVAYTG